MKTKYKPEFALIVVVASVLWAVMLYIGISHEYVRLGYNDSYVTSTFTIVFIASIAANVVVNTINAICYFTGLFHITIHQEKIVYRTSLAFKHIVWIDDIESIDWETRFWRKRIHIKTAKKKYNIYDSYKLPLHALDTLIHQRKKDRS